MSIGSYIGVPGISIDVESIEEVYEAIDSIHTQVMDNLGENDPMLEILENCMDEMIKKYGEKIAS